MAVVQAMWVAMVAVCGSVATAGETRAAAAWWRAAGEDLVQAWARQEEASTVTLLLLADGDGVEEAAWADTVRAMATRLTTAEEPWLCMVASLPSITPWRPDGRILLVAPLFTQSHARALSQVIGSSGRQVRRWLLLAGPRYEDLLPSLFLPHDTHVVVAQPGQVVQLWNQYQVAPGLKRHLHLRGTWAQDRPGSGSNDVEGGSLKLLQVPQRQFNLTGLHIRCLVEEWPPFTLVDTKNGKTRVSGVFYELWNILQGRLNFTYECRRSPDGEWGVQRPDGSWSGMIGQLVRDAADVILGSVDQTSVRSEAIDFAVPIVYSTFRLLVRKPNSPVGGWSSYSMEFTAGSWAGLVLTACVCCFVLTLVLRIASREQYASREAVLIVLGCMCQQGPVREETRWSARLVLLTVGVLGLVSVTHYSSVMISFLTLSRSSHPITSLQDLLHSSTYTLSIVRGTSTHDIIQASRRELYYQVWTGLLETRPDSFVATTSEGVHRAATEDYVFLIDENLYLNRYTRDCHLTIVGPRYLQMSSSFTFRKNFPYKHIFDQELRRMMEAGLLDREIRRKQARATCEAESITPIGLENTFTALLLLGTGVLLSLLLLLMEKLATRPATFNSSSLPIPRTQTLVRTSLVTVRLPGELAD